MLIQSTLASDGKHDVSGLVLSAGSTDKGTSCNHFNAPNRGQVPIPVGPA